MSDDDDLRVDEVGCEICLPHRFPACVNQLYRLLQEAVITVLEVSDKLSVFILMEMNWTW